MQDFLQIPSRELSVIFQLPSLQLFFLLEDQLVPLCEMSQPLVLVGRNQILASGLGCH